MAENISGITDKTVQSMDTLLSVVNSVCTILSERALTANTSANGALTVGNSFVSGIFGATQFAGSEFRGGTISASNTAVWTSNVQFQGTISVGNTTVNTQVNSTSISTRDATFSNASIQNLTQNTISFSNAAVTSSWITTTGTSPQVVDSFGLSIYRSAEYQVQITDNAANGYSMSRIHVLQTGSSVIFTEYGVLTSNGVLGAFSVSTNSTSAILSFTPASPNSTVKMVRTAIRL